ncbi:MAG TPA: exonuclease domain-containing protein [Candidatus Paceibacterota bacterium]|nr:exonuclease domain-containing protein [Candidatus Paceibacterota bacterium]
MRIIFFDTETTGGAENDRLIQLAIKERGVDAPILNATYKPPVPISFDSMAVHHITPKMVEERPGFVDAKEYTELKTLFEDPNTVAVAHNAAFDIAMLAREKVAIGKTICTYKVARALDPQETIGQYRLQYLRYFLGLEVEALAHDAFGDVLVLEAVFERLLGKMIQQKGGEAAALEEMVAISARPMLFTTLRFGKYKGKKIEEIARTDRGYLQWLLTQKRQDPAGEADWIYTLEQFLA